MTQQTTISLRPEQKDAVEEAQKLLEQENGYRPTQGETVAIACENLQAVMG